MWPLRPWAPTAGRETRPAGSSVLPERTGEMLPSPSLGTSEEVQAENAEMKFVFVATLPLLLLYCKFFFQTLKPNQKPAHFFIANILSLRTRWPLPQLLSPAIVAPKQPQALCK